DALHAAAANIDGSFDSTIKAAFGAFLAELIAFGNKVDSKGELAELTNAIPGLNQLQGRSASVAGLLGVSNVFNKLKSAIPTDASGITETKFLKVVADLNALAFGSGASGDDSLAVGFDSTIHGGYRGQSSTNALELTLALGLKAELKSSFPIGLGTQAQNAGISIKSNLDLDGKATADLLVGVVASASPSAFLDSSSNSSHIDFSIDASLHNINADVNLGFLDAGIKNGSIDLDGAVSVTFSGTGEITLGTSPSSLADLLPTIGSTGISGTGLSINLPISVSGGGLDFLAQNLLQGAAFSTTISAPDLFDGLHELSFSSLSSFSGANLFDFGSLTPTSVLGLLGNVFTSFAGVAGNSLLQTQIPFTGKTLGDALDF